MVKNTPLPPTLIFIFGGSGDLNYRKLTPALFNLFIDGSMPEKFHITGIARTEYPGDDYQKHLLEGIDKFSRNKNENGNWEEFLKHISYLQMDLGDEKAYQPIEDIVKLKTGEYGVHPRVIFFLG